MELSEEHQSDWLRHNTTTWDVSPPPIADLRNMSFEESFSIQYPNLNFADMRRQLDNWATNDFCTYWKNINTNTVYAYSKAAKSWSEPSNALQKLLLTYAYDTRVYNN